MAKPVNQKTKPTLLNLLAELFNNYDAELMDTLTDVEIDAELVAAGYDPVEIGKTMQAAANEALVERAKELGIAFIPKDRERVNEVS